MTSIEPLPTQRVPIVPTASHEIHSRRSSATSASGACPDSIGAVKSPDRCDFSPAALKKAREHYKASEMAMCVDCECVHAKGFCPLLAQCAERDAQCAEPLEERSDFNPGPIHPGISASAWFLTGAAAAALVIGLVF